jgi:diacylglycerol kinase (ATP)
MKNYPFHKRLGNAIAGLREGWRRERSFRTQVAAAGLALIALCVVRPAAIWWAVVALVVGMVLAIELLNGALEALIDHLHPQIHPQIRIVKDMAAASVLLVAFAAILIALALMTTVS